MQSNFRNADIATISIQYAKTSPTGEDLQILPNYPVYIFSLFCYNLAPLGKARGLSC